MSRDVVDKIVNSVLYEGYMLYPYRRSALKNRHRWNFGIVYPHAMDARGMQTECLIEGAPYIDLVVEVRFLQLFEQDSWQEATERRVEIAASGVHHFGYDSLQGSVAVQHEKLPSGCYSIRVEIANCTVRDNTVDPLLQSLVSTHTILRARRGHFVSLLDPPEKFSAEAAQCRNVGTWPVLVGNKASRDCMLSSPIILYDYPNVADESPGDLYDCTEIDEILTLRILTLTDSEKEEMRRSGERERRLLERAESLTADQLLKLHGAMRDVPGGLKRGDRVRLRPKPGGDVFDVVLAGRTAIIESIEQDFDDRIHVAVVIEDDPGKDLGMARQPGHRFFFSSDEVERIP